MIRILIADDHDVVRSGLRAILSGQPGWEVVELPTGHDPMVSMPDPLADVLIAVARR